MTTTQTNDNSSGIDLDADYLAPRELRVVLVCDVVESVRWMEQDEDYAVTRWQAFAQHVRGIIVPAHGGSVVKSTGDGMMVEFTNARSAVQAANALHAKAAQGNTDPNPQRHLQLRTGIHETHARRDAHDLYGHGVNLAARITTLAGPGEIIVSAPVRDHLTDVLDGDIEDMGECYLKHIAEPQRVYRVGVAGAEPILVPQREYAESLQPTVAVIPFESRSLAPEHFAVGDLIADGVIAQLSRTPDLKMISRLSSSIFRGRGFSVSKICDALGANYVVNGSYLLIDSKLLITAELCEAGSQHILWSARKNGDLQDLFDIQSEITDFLANGVHHVLLKQEAHKAQTMPLPTLSSYSLLIGGISMMHRQSPTTFSKAKSIFQHLQQRHPRIGASRAWLGKWYALASAQGWIDADNQMAIQVLNEMEEAIRLDDSLALSWTIKGLIHGYVQRDFDAAHIAYERASQINPNDALNWLYKGTLAAWTGDGHAAKLAADQAISLSKMDPIRYYYESLAGTAYIAAGEYQKAIALARASLRSNTAHASTHKTLTLALALDGQAEAAAYAAKNTLMQDPKFTTQLFSKKSPLGLSPRAKDFVLAYQSAGIPN